MSNGKGSKNRVTNFNKFFKNYDEIRWSKSKLKPGKMTEEEITELFESLNIARERYIGETTYAGKKERILRERKERKLKG